MQASNNESRHKDRTGSTPALDEIPKLSESVERRPSSPAGALMSVLGT